MSKHLRSGACLLACVVAVASAGRAASQDTSRAETPREAATFPVDARIALNALMSLGDAHLREVADLLTLLAATEPVRSGDWNQIRAPLAAAGALTVPAVHWFALPDGTYWTVEQGRAEATLADRAYFPGVLGGRPVMGALVVSRSSSRNTAIVAVPVRGADGAVVGVLGSSVHLDSLSARVSQEMGGVPDGMMFFAIDAEPLGALHSDPALIFTEPMKLGDEDMRRAFTEMLAHEQGQVTYTFRGTPRTVLYRRSPVTGWWYGFGMVQR